MSSPHAARSPLRDPAPSASRASNSPALAPNPFAQSDNLDHLFGSADGEFLDPAALPFDPFDGFESIEAGEHAQFSEHIDFNDATFNETFDINNISGFSDADLKASTDFENQHNPNLFYGDNSNYATPFITDTQQDQKESLGFSVDCITSQTGDGDSDNGTEASHHSGSSSEHGSDDHASPAPINILNPGQPLPDVANMSVPEMDRLYLKLMRHHGFQPIQRRTSGPAAQVPLPASAPATTTAPLPAPVSASTSASVPALARSRAATIATVTPATDFAIPAPVTTIATAGFNLPAPPPPHAPIYTNGNSTLTEQNYHPLTQEGILPADPQAPRPIYPAYTGHFATGQEARQHRKRRRIAPKSSAPDLERVKRYGRMYWTHRIYNAMIDISCTTDGRSSIHRTRFEQATAFDALDLEAAAHHVFDAALAVHDRGWNRPLVYHKRVVRGKLIDVSERSVEKRLARICTVLQQKKATVDDAVRGGVTLALLCDNPEARGFTKCSNNVGNEKRGKRLKFVKEMRIEGDGGEEEDEEDEEERG
ncbi:hypothetical protein DDE82_007088 [Stemphylium lycopersici]|nr:hypothetical protein TW65_08913 [Stemphylium lycopersici]RAR00716.1 hypothetical protein DDE82_007088 [Stemphylium lycopersici]